MFLNPATETEIFNIVNNLKIKKKKKKKISEHDGISNILLKHISKFILSRLTDLVNRSIETGRYIPQIFKIAKVLPLYKSKEQDQLTNY